MVWVSTFRLIHYFPHTPSGQLVDAPQLSRTSPWTLGLPPTSLSVRPSTLHSSDEHSRTKVMRCSCAPGQSYHRKVKSADCTTWISEGREGTLSRCTRQSSMTLYQIGWISTLVTASTSNGLVRCLFSSLSLSLSLSLFPSVFLGLHKYPPLYWTISLCAGSNTHNNGNPGGDGQTGDAGECRGGTDRNNIVQVSDPNTNYPVPWENATLFKDAEVIWASFADDPNNPSELSVQDVATAFASSGYYRCVQSTTCTDSVQTKATLQQLLNNASPLFEGAILRFTRHGTYYYICSRNNNFTNRSQKGQLTVSWFSLVMN